MLLKLFKHGGGFCETALLYNDLFNKENNLDNKVLFSQNPRPVEGRKAQSMYLYVSCI